MATESKKTSSKVAAKTASAAQTITAKSVTVQASQVVINGGVMKDKVVPFLVALVVIAAFAVGLLYGKVSVYEKGVVAGTLAGKDSVPTADAGDTIPQEPPAPAVLTGDLWDEVLDNPVAVKGDSGAKVTVVEFTDYQCPFCARYYEDSYGQIMSDYVDGGDVYYVMRDLPLSFHENAKPAAIAARCAGDQDKYWEMHDTLFANQEAWSAGDPQEAFEGYAGEIGIDAGEFGSCLTSGKHDEAVDADLALASKVGATGTPTFFVNGEMLVGAQPYAAFQTAIDAALAE